MPLNVLVVDRTPPSSLTQGGSLIGRHVFARLSRRHRLTLLSPIAATARPDLAVLRDIFEDVHLVPVRSPIAAIRGWFEAEAAMRTVSVAPADARRVAAAAAALAEHGGFDAIHVRQLPMAPYGRAFGRTPRLLELVDSETLGSRRTAREAAADRRHRRRAIRSAARAALARVVEARAVAAYRTVTTVAEADAAAIRALAPRSRVEVIPNGVDASQFAPTDQPEEPDTLTFVGAMDFPPNVAAARYLVDRVLPRVRTPGVRVRLVGRSPAPAVRALAERVGVEVTGEVDDVRPWLSTTSLVVCPMVSGSGIKNKVLEAMAMARPIIATPLALEGLEGTSGIVAVAGEPGRLADEIDRLLADAAIRREMGARARALVLDRYSWEACADAYERLYERMIAEAPSERRTSRAPLPVNRPTRSIR